MDLLSRIASFLAPKTTAAGSGVKNTAGMLKDYIEYNLARDQKEKQKQLLEYNKKRNLANEALKQFGFDAGKRGNQFDPGQFAKGVGQGGLELGSYAVPFGKGANIAQKVLLPGATVGAMQAGARDEVSPGSIAGGALTGAAGAGVMRGATNLLGGIGSSLTKKLPERLMESVFREPIKDTRTAIKTGQSLGKEALKRGVKGSEESILRQAIQRIDSLEDTLQTKLNESKRIIPIADIKKTVQPLVDKYNKSGNLSAVKEVTDRIAALEQYHGKSIPVNVANEVKRALYDEVRNSYGTLASSNKEAIKTIARGLKESIAKKIPGANEVNKELSVAGRIQDSMLDKVARGARNNVFSLTDTVIGAGGIAGGFGAPTIAAILGKKAIGSTAGKTNIANILSKVGQAGERINLDNPILQTILGQVGARSPQIFSEKVNTGELSDNNNANQSQEQFDPGLEVTLLDGTKTTFGQLQQQGTFQQQQQPGMGGLSEDQLSQLSLLALITGDTKALQQIAAYQGIQEKMNKQDKLPAATENRVQLANSGLRALDEIEKILQEDPDKVLKSATPGKLGARDYDSAAFRAVEGLLRARSGAAIPETEVRRYMNANLPRIGDSPEEVRFKLDAFRRDLEEVSKSGGGTDDMQILQQFLGL